MARRRSCFYYWLIYGTGRSVVWIKETGEDVAQTKVWIWLHWATGLEGHVGTRRPERPFQQLMWTALPQSRFTELGSATGRDVSSPAHTRTWRSYNWFHFILPLLMVATLCLLAAYNSHEKGDNVLSRHLLSRASVRTILNRTERVQYSSY